MLRSAADCRSAPAPVTTESLQAADPRVSSALHSRQRLLAPDDDPLLPQPNQLQQLSRLTVVASDAAAAATTCMPGNPVTSLYDILAVQPTTERVFTQVHLAAPTSLMSWKR